MRCVKNKLRLTSTPYRSNINVDIIMLKVNDMQTITILIILI